MKTAASFLFYFLLSISVRAQVFIDTLFQHHTVKKAKLGSIDIHVTKTGNGEAKPLIVYLDGSGNYPIYYKTKSDRYSSSIALNIKKYAKDYYVALISKPGTPFKDSLQYTSSGRATYPENESYKKLYSLDWRAGAASEAINYLLETLPVDKKHIIVMGYSEGAQVAPRVAVLNKKVTHVVCMVGNALDQLFDFIVDARLQVERKEITANEGQRIVDSLYAEYEKIHSDPLATNKFWYGATYLKWGSFSKSSPLENMLQLSIPILYIAAGKDNNQTIIGMDYAKLEFLRRGKKNLTYKVYPNANHYFEEEENINGTIKKTDRLDEVHQFAIDWIKNSKG